MLLLLLGSFVAGMLTVLAPCVLPLLPIIIGGSVSGDTKDRSRPVIITVSLALSLIIFTLLLKATSLLINVPPMAITYISGGIIILLGILTLFPGLYARIIAKLGIETRAQKSLSAGYRNKSHLIGPIVTGAALGPVFSSCSPVYAYILATVLPASFGTALVYVISYVLGLSLVLLLIGFYGQKFISRIKFASNPKGAFQRSIAVLFILVGIMIATGYGTKIQTYVSAHTPFNFDALNTAFLPKSSHQINDKTLYNVTPYPAPEFTGIQEWINSNPLTMKQLRGKVVLVDFWTYSCINCIRSLPYVESWQQTYGGSNFTVVGVHAPEFAFEKVPSNVKAAVKKDGLTYPVALDNDLSTWDAFQNQYWPAEYLIDAKGMVRRVKLGEGDYNETEQAIRGLIQESGAMLPNKMATTAAANNVPVTSAQTPETYLGSARASNYAGTPALGAQPTNTFTDAKSLDVNQWSLSGKWQVDNDKITALGDSTLTIRIATKEAYLVAGSTNPAKIGVMLNGKPISTTGDAGPDIQNSSVTVGASTLYRLVTFPSFTKDSTLKLTVPTGTQLNVFTFGS